MKKEEWESIFGNIDKHPTGGDFSWALACLKNGHKIAREGWNGKGMWLQLVKGSDYTVSASVVHEWIAAGGGVETAPWIGMKTAQNTFVPWLASQGDLLAEDWVIAT